MLDVCLGHSTSGSDPPFRQLAANGDRQCVVQIATGGGRQVLAERTLQAIDQRGTDRARLQAATGSVAAGVTSVTGGSSASWVDN